MTRNPIRSSAALGCAAALIMLTACGGGGGGSRAPSGPSPSGTVSGSATKGIVRNADVRMEQFNASGQPVLIGTGTTDMSGNYSVAYSNYSGGPVQVCIKAKADMSTTVVCDASDGPNCGPAPAGGASVGDANNNQVYNLGESIPAPQNFEMCTCLPEPPATGVRAPITPFTQLVVARAGQLANAQTSLTAALNNAASEISQLIGGLDVLRLEPINLADPDAVANASSDALVYAALVAATLSTQDRNNPLDLSAVITELVNRAGDGSISVANLRDLVNNAQDQLAGVTASDVSGVLASLQAQADEAESACEGAEDCTFDPAPAPNADSSRIGRAKQLVRNVRTTFNGLNDLETPAQTFGTQVDMVSAVLGQKLVGPGEVELDLDIIGALFGSAGFAISEAVEFVNLQTTDGDVANGSLEVMNFNSVNGEEQSFTITISGTTQKTVTIVGAAEEVDIDLTLSAPNNAENNTTQTLVASIHGTIETNTNTTGVNGTGLQLTIPPGAPTRATLIKTGAVALNDGDPNTPDDLRVSSFSFSLGNVVLEQIRTPQDQAGGAVQFAGSIGTTFVRCTKASCVARETQTPSEQNPDAGFPTFVPSAFNLNGSFSNALNSTAISVTGTIANAANFDPDLTDAQQADTNGNLISPSNFPQATVTLQFDADLGDVAPARVVISGSQTGVFNQPGGNGGVEPDVAGSITVNLLRGGSQVFRIQGTSRDDGDDTGGSITITDSTSATITLDLPGNATNPVLGSIRVDGVQVGDVRRLSSGLVVFRYDDGSLETFN